HHRHRLDRLDDPRRLVVGGHDYRNRRRQMGGEHVLGPPEQLLAALAPQDHRRADRQGEQPQLHGHEVGPDDERDAGEEVSHVEAAAAARRRSFSDATPARTRSAASASTPEIVSWFSAVSAAEGSGPSREARRWSVPPGSSERALAAFWRTHHTGS